MYVCAFIYVVIKQYSRRKRLLCILFSWPLFFFLLPPDICMRFALWRVRETWRTAGMYYYNKDPRVLTVRRQSARTCVSVRASLALRAHQNPFYNPLIPPGYRSPPRVCANVGDLLSCIVHHNRTAAHAIVVFPSNYVYLV